MAIGNLLDRVVEETNSKVAEVLVDDRLDEFFEKVRDVVQADVGEVLRKTTTRLNLVSNGLKTPDDGSHLPRSH